jgi:hypothetical protein
VQRSEQLLEQRLHLHFADRWRTVAALAAAATRAVFCSWVVAVLHSRGLLGLSPSQPPRAPPSRPRLAPLPALPSAASARRLLRLRLLCLLSHPAQPPLASAGGGRLAARLPAPPPLHRRSIQESPDKEVEDEGRSAACLDLE